MNTTTTTSTHPVEDDVEQIGLTSLSDPYSLSTRLVSEDELSKLRHRKGHNVRDFYKDQNQSIKRMLKSVDDHRTDADLIESQNALKVCLKILASKVLRQ